MAKKKHHPPKEGPKPRERSEAGLPGRLLNRRAMEDILRGFLGKLLGPAEETPLTKAQDIAYRAFEAPDPGKRAELAKQALALSPDCADAYVLLAGHASTRKDALDLYQQAVAAGERA